MNEITDMKDFEDPLGLRDAKRGLGLKLEP